MDTIFHQIIEIPNLISGFSFFTNFAANLEKKIYKEIKMVEWWTGGFGESIFHNDGLPWDLHDRWRGEPLFSIARMGGGPGDRRNL